ncbi:MAG: hypothetical protein C0501_30150 [Isosphaera sp.]|nr:hypothetical protein [Isosphaera sp.]
MTRPVGLAAVVCASLAGAGCTTLGDDWASFGRALGWEEVKTPRDPKLPAAHLATTERVEALGRRIVAQNALTGSGIEPMFFTVGVAEPVLFHRGAEELFVSEGLVKQCQSEAELAAVLCSELGQMIIEKRAARRAGVDRDTIPDAALPGGQSPAGGVADDPGRAAEIAFRERRQAKAAPLLIDAGEAAKHARDLLKGAGFKPEELDRVEPLLRQSERSAALRKQMSGSAPPPTWDK